MSTPESLAAHMEWLYGENGVHPGNKPCPCPHAWVSQGRVEGVNMGKGWSRMSTHPDCPHHGKCQGYTKAYRAQDKKKRWWGNPYCPIHGTKDCPK